MSEVLLCHWCGKSMRENEGPVKNDEGYFHQECLDRKNHNLNVVAQAAPNVPEVYKEPIVSEPETKYEIRPRNDMVVIRVVKIQKIRGVAISQKSPEAQKHIVVAVGPHVKAKDLKPGMQVQVAGRLNEHFSGLGARFPDLIITAQENVITELIPQVEGTAYEEVTKD